MRKNVVTRVPFEKRNRPIDCVCAHEELAECLVEHGALVDGGDDEFPDGLEPCSPMLLLTCAVEGFVRVGIPSEGNWVDLA